MRLQYIAMQRPQSGKFQNTKNTEVKLFFCLLLICNIKKRQKIFVLTFPVIFNGNKETVDFLDKLVYFYVHFAGNGIDQHNLVFFLGFHFG